MSTAPPSPARAAQRDHTRLPVITVHPDLEPALSKGHPWLYRDHLPPKLEHPTGTWLAIRCGSFTGLGIFDASSALAVRLYGAAQVPDAAWFERRVRRARERRSVLLDDGQTTAYRLLNGEGDGVPGIVVDVYGKFAVLRLDSTALAALSPLVVAAVEKAIEVQGIVQKREGALEVLAGRAPPEQLIVSEHGVRFHADLASGQKTGLFLDHRENRRELGRWCRGASVLNMFAYTGGFSLHAARGGARRVVSVDRAGDALARARDNVSLNGFDAGLFEFETADGLTYLERARDEGQRFEVVITDPPSFARNRMQRRRALRTYERLHELALSVLTPGGLYAAASCTSQIDIDTFKESIARAAARAGRALQIVLEPGQALDHPVMVGHPEGRYLKFVALRSIED